MGEYIPRAPVNDEARKYNQNLPGMGGVFNTVNLHVYHYAGNNPVKYTDPDGEDFYNFTQKDIVVVLENRKGSVDYVNVPAGEMYTGKIDGVVLSDDTVVKVTGTEWAPSVHLVVETVGNEDVAYVVGSVSMLVNDGGDLVKKFEGKGDLLSGVYTPEAAKSDPKLNRWVESAKDSKEVGRNDPDVHKMSVGDILRFAFRADTRSLLKKRG
jgi:hypothetical protein